MEFHLNILLQINYLKTHNKIHIERNLQHKEIVKEYFQINIDF